MQLFSTNETENPNAFQMESMLWNGMKEKCEQNTLIFVSFYTIG